MLAFLFATPLLLVTMSVAVASSNGADLEVSRHHGGDLFRDCVGCGPDAAQAPGGGQCRCQCAPSHHTYREDIRMCVRDLGECRLGAFVRPGAPMEQMPLVFLPLAGQIVHPGAHLSLTGMAPIDPLWCRVNRTQYLSPEGWLESRDPTSSSTGGQPFALYRASNRTFLQWLGGESERRKLQHKLILLRVRCTDDFGAVFEPCIAFRAGWAPGISPVERRTTDYTVVGLCLGVLGLAYVLAVLVYLRVRQANVKSTFRSYLEEEQTSTADPLLPSFGRSRLPQVREMVAAARARLRSFRFRPSLVDIPEDDYYHTQLHQQHLGLQQGHHHFAKKSDLFSGASSVCNGTYDSSVRHNPLHGVDCHRFFEVNESFQDSPLEALAHQSPYPPRPPERRRKKLFGKETQQARFDLFRKDLYEKLQRLQESRAQQPTGVRCEPDGNSDSPCYENVLPAPLPKGSFHDAPPRPPPRLCSSPVDQLRSDDLDGDNGSSTSVDLDSLYSPCDSLNSRNITKLSVPPDQTLLEGLDEPIIFDSLHNPRPTYIMNSARVSPDMIVKVASSFKPTHSGLYMSVQSLQKCIKTTSRFGPCPRGFDAMDALRRVTAGDIEFMHVCRGQLKRRDSVGCSSVASDSLVPSPSDSEYDPDYSDPSPQTDARVVSLRRTRRRFRSRAERSGKHAQPPPPPDVTIIEVGDAAGDILNGKGNFVTLIELDTSESSN
ncbi:hypothetical protein V5799_008765 [Amblyomma americanum]|uniref:Shavenoid isoform B-like N-terminal domain-containing protein n=3 Tax=Amblyomma americanum TaxID=6943 RepID=A0AAQ4FCH4_AMBAM